MGSGWGSPKLNFQFVAVFKETIFIQEETKDCSTDRAIFLFIFFVANANVMKDE